MTEKLLSALQLEIQNGNFKSASKTLEKCSIDSIKSPHLVKLFIISLETTKKLNPINDEELVTLIKCLCGRIVCLSDAHYEKYLQCVATLVRYLSSKNDVSNVLQLTDVILPKCLPLNLTKTQTNLYYTTVMTIYSIFAKIVNSRAKEHKENVLPFSNLITSVLYRTQSQNFLLEHTKRCISAMFTFEILPSKIEEFYLNQLDRIETINSADYQTLLGCLAYFYQHKKISEANKCFSTTFSKFSTNHFNDLFQILSLCDWIFEKKGNDPRTLFTTFQKYCKTNGLSSDLQATCKLILKIIVSALDTPTFKERTLQEQFDLIKLLECISKLFQNVPVDCKCQQNCMVKTDLHESYEYYVLISKIYKNTKLFDKKITQLDKGELVKSFEKYFSIVKLLKSQNCDHWKKGYMTCCTFFYEIGCLFYKNEDLDIAATYMKKFIKTVIYFEGLTPTKIEQQYVNSAFKIISNNYNGQQQFEAALATLAFSMAISTDKESPSMKLWIKAKMSCRENTNLQEWTTVTALENCNKEISSTYFIDTKFTLSDEQKIRILQLELNSYNAMWKSKLPMASAFKQLATLLDPFSCAKIATEIFQFGNNQVHDSLPDLLRALTKKLENYNISTITLFEKSIYLAHLHFLNHKYQMMNAIVKNCSEIEKTMMNITKQQNGDDLVPGDPADDYDVVSTYSSLKLSKYMKMMTQLDTSFEVLQKAFLSDYENEQVDFDQLYNLLIHLSHEYYLHNHKIKSLTMLRFALKIANKLSNNKYIFETTGFILEQSCGTTKKIDELIQTAEKFVPELENQKLNEEIITYYLGKAECFAYSDYIVAQNSLKKVLEYSEKFELSSFLKARMHYIQHKLLSLVCKYNETEHKQFTCSKAYWAAKYNIKYYETEFSNSGNSSYKMAVFFKIQEEISKMYVDLHLPRETVCYTKDVLVIAQQMILPFRVTKFIYYFAQAEILYGRFDDCEEKLSGLGTMLGISKRHPPNTHTPIKSPNKKIDEDNLDNIVDGFREMALDAPALVEVQPGSPSFYVETFKFPQFLNHKITCQCFNCNWLEYQVSVVQRALLQGTLHIYRNNEKIANRFFNGGLRIYEILQQRNDKLFTQLNLYELMLSPTQLFNDTYYLTLIELGDVCLRRNNLEEAEKVNSQLIKTFNTNELGLTHIYNKIIVQKMNIIHMRLLTEQKPSTNSLFVDSSECSQGVTTPESKFSMVTVTLERTPEDFVPSYPVHKMKPIKHNFEENSEQEVKPAKTRMKSCKAIAAATAKTPAPKIKVFTERPTRKKKILTETATPQVEEVPNTSDFLIPCSPDAYASAKKSNKLTARSKLLTERLKNSTNKKVENENLPSSTKKTVRTNLLLQLENDDDPPKLRRSRRIV